MKKDSNADKFRDQWYETYLSIIYTPKGEVPQTKGPWTDIGPVEEMLTFLKGEYPGGGELLVVDSRCGHIDVTPADFWSEMNKVHAECAEEEAAYIKAGICSDCGACSRNDAATKCRPTRVGDSGDYSCNGERLWEDETESDDPTSPDYIPDVNMFGLSPLQDEG